ncbi:hypothetical protein [Streptomyces umbrinus]|uniref:hypothetical protein n=1 Tax=Streptomyces umbrinus TaxID=67370 RepID=UPI0027D85B3A|nr:hypothetical protein [Streptomyces umbrinus]
MALRVLADQRPGDGIAYTHRLKPRRALDFELREGPRPKDVLLHDNPAAARPPRGRGVP